MSSTIKSPPPIIITESNTGSGSSSGLMSIVGAIILIAIIGVGVYFFFFKGSSNPPAETKTYKCQTDGSCVEDPTGQGDYTDPNCAGECTKPPPPTPDRYSCSGDDKGTCKKDPNGPFDSPDNCKCWGCSNNSCSPVTAGQQGTYKSQDECAADTRNCNISTYSCKPKTIDQGQYNTCEIDGTSNDNLDACKKKCLTYYCDNTSSSILKESYTVGDTPVPCRFDYWDNIPDKTNPKRSFYLTKSECDNSCHQCPNGQIYDSGFKCCHLPIPENAELTSDCGWKCKDGFIRPPDCQKPGSSKNKCVQVCTDGKNFVCDPNNPNTDAVCCDSGQINCSGDCCITSNCKQKKEGGGYTCCQGEVCYDGNCCHGQEVCDDATRKCKIGCGKLKCDEGETCVTIEGNINDDSLRQLINEQGAKVDKEGNTLYMCIKQNECQLSQGNPQYLPPAINNFYPCLNGTGTSFETDASGIKTIKGIGFAYPKTVFGLRAAEDYLNNLYLHISDSKLVGMNMSNYNDISLYYGKINYEDTHKRIYNILKDKTFLVLTYDPKNNKFINLPYDPYNILQFCDYDQDNKIVRIGGKVMTANVDAFSGYLLNPRNTVPNTNSDSLIHKFEIVDLDPMHSKYMKEASSGYHIKPEQSLNKLSKANNPELYWSLNIPLSSEVGVSIGSDPDPNKLILSSEKTAWFISPLGYNEPNRIWIMNQNKDAYCITQTGNANDIVLSRYDPNNKNQEITILYNKNNTKTFFFNNKKLLTLGNKKEKLHYNWVIEPKEKLLENTAEDEAKATTLQIQSCYALSYDKINSTPSRFSRVKAHITRGDIQNLNYLALSYSDHFIYLITYSRTNATNQMWMYGKVSNADAYERLSLFLGGEYYCATLNENNVNLLFVTKYEPGNKKQEIIREIHNDGTSNFIFTNGGGTRYAIGVIYDNTKVPDLSKQTVGVAVYDKKDQYKDTVCYDWIIEEITQCEWVDIFQSAEENMDDLQSKMQNYSRVGDYASFGNWCRDNENTSSNRFVLIGGDAQKCNALGCWNKIVQKGVLDVRYNEKTGQCMAIQDCSGKIDYPVTGRTVEVLPLKGNTAINVCSGASCPSPITDVGNQCAESAILPGKNDIKGVQQESLRSMNVECKDYGYYIPPLLGGDSSNNTMTYNTLDQCNQNIKCPDNFIRGDNLRKYADKFGVLSITPDKCYRLVPKTLTDDKYTFDIAWKDVDSNLEFIGLKDNLQHLYKNTFTCTGPVNNNYNSLIGKYQPYINSPQNYYFCDKDGGCNNPNYFTTDKDLNVSENRINLPFLLYTDQIGTGSPATPYSVYCYQFDN